MSRGQKCLHNSADIPLLQLGIRKRPHCGRHKRREGVFPNRSFYLVFVFHVAILTVTDSFIYPGIRGYFGSGI